MASRSPRTYPPGTFIPTPQRLMAIGQLCLAFSLMVWYMVQPFMGEYFTLRSRMLLYEYVMGTSDVLKAEAAKMDRHAQHFQQLPFVEQQLFTKDYQALKQYATRTPLKKVEDGFRFFILDVPPFEQAWIFFSIIIAVLILLKREGARQAAWILPLLVIAYAADNQLTGNPAVTSPDAFLFPSEEVLLRDYLREPLASDVLTQKDQLERGWKQYLLKNWSANLKEEEALENAEFQFTLARLKLLHSQPYSEWLHPSHQKSHPAVLLLYFLWNVFFAWTVNRSPLKHTQSSFLKA